MAKIRILQIIGSSDIGGSEKIVSSLVKHLNKDKFDIFLACPPGGPMLSDFKKYALEVKIFNFRNWTNPFTIISLRNYMQEKRFDVVHTHLYSADFMGTIAAVLAGVRRRISTVHGYNFSSTYRFTPRGVKNFFFSFVYRGIYFFSTRLIAVSEAVRRDLIERPGIKVGRDKIEVVYNGIDIEAFRDSGGVALDKAYRYAAVIANFDRIKGHHILLKAIPLVLRHVEKARFLFVGGGRERPHIEKAVRRLKIEKDVIFTGPRRDIYDLMKAARLIVVPSLKEGLPLVVLEAMASARPVVAARAGGLPELVKEGENAVLVSPSDYKEMSQAIIRVLKDDALAAAMGNRGRDMFNSRAYDRFKAGYMVKEIERLYQDA